MVNGKLLIDIIDEEAPRNGGVCAGVCMCVLCCDLALREYNCTHYTHVSRENKGRGIERITKAVKTSHGCVGTCHTRWPRKTFIMLPYILTKNAVNTAK